MRKNAVIGRCGTSAGNRPNLTFCCSNRLVYAHVPTKQRIISSNIWRIIRMGIAGLEGVVCPINPRSYTRVRMRRVWCDPVFCVRPEGYGRIDLRPANSSRKTRAVFGADVYRKSTGVSAFVLERLRAALDRGIFVEDSFSVTTSTR